jgi:peptidoglycan/LPS O-acetylase OafA/YrhL
MSLHSREPANHPTPHSSDGSAPRLATLDAFRALAVCGVVAVHYMPHWDMQAFPYNPFGYQQPFPGWISFGAFGVQLFFIVSGFVIFMTLERCQHLAEFAVRRWARLYPCYLAAMLLTFTIATNLGPAPMRNSGYDLLAGSTMVGALVHDARYVDGVYWTLTVELQFYALIGVVYLLAGRRIELGWVLIVTIATLLWRLDFGHDHSLAHRLADRVLIARFLPHFTLGMAFYSLHRHRLGSAAMLAGSALASYALVYATAPLSTHIAHLVLLALFTLFAIGRLDWLAVRPLLFVGHISYPLYLCHDKLGVMAIGLMTRRLHLPELAAIAVAMAAAVLLAYALHRAVELPAQRALLRYWKLRQSVITRHLPGFRFTAAQPTATARPFAT